MYDKFYWIDQKVRISFGKANVLRSYFVPNISLSPPTHSANLKIICKSQ